MDANATGSVVFLWAIAGAIVMVYLPFLAVAWERLRLGYDFSAPREMFAKLPPYARRATWAHQNGFESFAFFAPSALMAYVTGVDSPWAIYGAIAYLVARAFYGIFYIADIPLLRSAMFAVGSASYYFLIFLSLQAAGAL